MAHIYFIITIGGLIGIVLHALRSISLINKRNQHVTFKMVFYEYWKTDWFSLICATFCFIALIFVSSEFINYQDITGVPADPTQDLKDKLVHFQFRNFVKASSVFAGYFSDSIVYGFLGLTGKKLAKQYGIENPAEDKPGL